MMSDAYVRTSLDVFKAEGLGTAAEFLERATKIVAAVKQLEKENRPAKDADVTEFTEGKNFAPNTYILTSMRMYKAEGFGSLDDFLERVAKVVDAADPELH